MMLSVIAVDIVCAVFVAGLSLFALKSCFELVVEEEEENCAEKQRRDNEAEE